MWKGWGVLEEEVGSHPYPQFLQLLGVGTPGEPVTDGGGLRGDGGAGCILWALGVDWDASPGFRSDQVRKLSSVRVRRAWDLRGAMLRAPVRRGGCKGTASARCTRLLCWTPGSAGRRAPAALGRPNLGPCGTRAQECMGTPGSRRCPARAGTLRSGPDQTVASPALGTSGEWPPPGSVGRAVRGQRCPACSLSRWASGAWTAQCVAGRKRRYPAARSDWGSSPGAGSWASLPVRAVIS